MTAPRTLYTLITGASGGIGADLADICAGHGHSLILVARSEAKLRALAGELTQKYGVQVQVVAKDLSISGAARDLVGEVHARGWEIDTLINNAGYGANGRFDQLDLEFQSRMIQLNITALVELTHLCLPAMIQAKRGYVLNVASTAAFQPGPMMAVYYATKAFVLHFSEAIAEELEDSGVTITALCPGPTETGFAEVAAMTRSRLFNMMKPARSREVAILGEQAMRRGQRVAIYGVLNKFVTQMVRLSPRNLNLKVVKHLQSQKEGERKS